MTPFDILSWIAWGALGLTMLVRDYPKVKPIKPLEQIEIKIYPRPDYQEYWKPNSHDYKVRKEPIAYVEPWPPQEVERLKMVEGYDPIRNQKGGEG